MGPSEHWICDDESAAPLTTRTITMSCFADGELLEVRGRLSDTRDPVGVLAPDGMVHDMELCMKVDAATLVITAVRATMRVHPHMECSDIEPAFEQLVGVSVARGYTRKVQELLGRTKGCTHLEFLARALGTVVIQGKTVGAASGRASGMPPGAQDGGWLANTCHVWADDGVAPVKLRLGWVPGTVYPVPRVETYEAKESSDGTI
jgi:hypothetical protein